MVGGRGRRQKKQNSIKGETQAIGTYVFCQISALVPIEVNCEICIYFTDLSEAAYTWQCSPKQLHIALPGPLEAHKTTRLYATALEKRSLARTLPSTSGLFNVIFKRFSPSLRSKGGEDLSDCICDPGNSSQAETAESLIFRKIT